jgi:hypothetical protein
VALGPKVPGLARVGRKELHLFATRMEHQRGERVVTAATRGFDEPLLAPWSDLGGCFLPSRHHLTRTGQTDRWPGII